MSSIDLGCHEKTQKDMEVSAARIRILEGDLRKIGKLDFREFVVFLLV